KDAKARVWDVVTEEDVTKQPLEHATVVTWVDFSPDPDGTHLVTASLDGTAKVWDATTFKRVSVLKHSGPVQQASFSADGRRVLAVGTDRAGRVWDAVEGTLEVPLLRHNGVVYRASFSCDGRYVVTASEDGTARLWDTEGYQPRTLLPKHEK